MLILKLWEDQPGDYFFLCSKSATGKWSEHGFHRSEFDQVAAFLRKNKDRDLYFCPHGFTRKNRLKEYSVDPHLLYADLDEVDPKKLSIRPTVALESSPGRHVGLWITDSPASEELNRRMSYSIQADLGGWDRTQVLRIPNTRNYKYKSTPRVRILWTNGPHYQTRRLEKSVPSVDDNLRSSEGVEESRSIFEKYEKRMSAWARRQLLAGRAIEGKRSEVLWKLQNHLLEIGLSRDEAFKLLWSSPWNKFRDRRNGADVLWKTLDKALETHLSGFKVTSDKAESKPGIDMKPISEVEMENIDWLIPRFLARRELTIVEGDPGLGKSYFVEMVAKHICDGECVPTFEEYTSPVGKVVYFDIENTAATVTKPRLECNGLKRQDNFYQVEEPLTIDDEERWEMAIQALEEVRPTMVVFDTINTYIGSADTYRASETQQAMGRFKEIASRFDCSVVVLRHLTKGSKDKAIYRGQGSIAFTGAARIVATCVLAPDDEDIRVVACTKNNISPKFQSFTFTIEPLPDKGKWKNRSRLVWGEKVDWSADDLLGATPSKNENEKEKAEEFLRAELAEGEVELSALIERADARSISESTLRRAAERLGVNKKSQGFGKKRVSYWLMP